MKLVPLLLLSLTLCGLLTVVHAQPAGPIPVGAKQVPVRNLGVCFLYAPTVPELYYRDAKNQYTPLKIDTVRFSSWNAIPDKDTLELYKKKVSPEVSTVDTATGKKTIVSPEATTYDPAQTWTLTPGKESMRRLYYHQSDGQVKSIDWNVSPDGHGPLQVRVMNLLNQPLALRLGSQNNLIGAGQQKILTSASAAKESYTFQYGFERSDIPPFVSPVKILGFRRPLQRLTIIIGYLPTVDTGDGSTSGKITGYIPQDLRFYEDTDRIPPPLPPVTVYPKTALR